MKYDCNNIIIMIYSNQIMLFYDGYPACSFDIKYFSLFYNEIYTVAKSKYGVWFSFKFNNLYHYTFFYKLTDFEIKSILNCLDKCRNDVHDMLNIVDILE